MDKSSGKRMDGVMQLELDGLKHRRSGKVREVYETEEGDYVIVATDRVSAFDCILPEGIPGKGQILTAISLFWFEYLSDEIPNHLVVPGTAGISDELRRRYPQIAGRAMQVRKCQPLPIECVVRGYLTGSGWKEYQKHGTVCGQKLPGGLQHGDALPSPIFTPATKAEVGHDMNISFEEAGKLVHANILDQARSMTLRIYERAHAKCLDLGLIIADTKFEFGLHEGQLVLIDEVLTPDSSRFWARHCHMPGAAIQFGFDKQLVRNYLETLDWDKQPPAPSLPPELILEVQGVYRFIARLLGVEN